METGVKKIVSFRDLDVYQRSYRASVQALPLINFLRKIREFDTADQLSRCTKAVPALIAEGYAKRFQPKHLDKYIDDGIGEANESIVHISHTMDLGYPNKEECEDLISEYEIIGKQLYNFGKSWQSSRKRHAS